jgi:vacuolar protein sorting-associated protein 3
METSDTGGNRSVRNVTEDGPFVLRSLLDDVPLSADGPTEDIKINCVDYLGHFPCLLELLLGIDTDILVTADRNLYVGTSASELLHFVQIPPDPAGRPVFILASRLRPGYAEASHVSGTSRPGVQQILLLPRVGKACILCNWTVTFYSLPELSPVYGTLQVKNCNWIGGVDLNEQSGDDDGVHRPPGVTILLSLNRRIQVVRIGEDARVVKVRRFLFT